MGKVVKAGLKGTKSIVEERTKIRKHLKIRNMEKMKGVR